MYSIFSGNFSGGVKNGLQPDPYLAMRSNTASTSPPIHTGMCGFWAGFGANNTSLNETYFPSKVGDSEVHSSMMAAMYSSAILPRSWNGTPSRSNSSFNQPTPNAAMRRPPDIQSMVESDFAITIGCCNGSNVM